MRGGGARRTLFTTVLVAAGLMAPATILGQSLCDDRVGAELISCLEPLTKSASKADRARALYLLSRALPPGARARTAAAEAARLAPDSVDYLVHQLTTWLEDRSNNSTRMGRRSVERRLAQRILELDAMQPLALETAGRWEVDELFWNAYSESRFRTEYFKKRRVAAAEKARDYLLRLRAAEPASARPYRMLARLFILTTDWDRLLAIADSMTAGRPTDATPLLYRAVAHQALGRSRDAAEAFARYFAQADPNLQLVFDDPARFRRDAGELRSAPAISSGDAFWSLRDPRLLSPENERLIEHRTRMAMADILLGVDSANRGWDQIEGDLIVRFGLPADPAVTLSPYGGLPNPYTDDDPMGAGQKYWPIPGSGKGVVLSDVFRNGTFEFGNPVDAHDVFFDTPETYAHEEPGRRLVFPHTASVFRGSGGRSKVVTAIGIPIIEDAIWEGTLRAEMEVGYFLTDRSGVVSATRRPILSFHSDGLTRTGPDVLWTGVLQTMASPGRYGASTEFELVDRSVVGFQRDSLIVPAFPPDSLSMSDVMLAYLVLDGETEPEPHTFRSSGFTVFPAPWSVFERSQPMYLFFEMYGLSSTANLGANYRVEAVLERADKPSLLGRIGRLFGGDAPNSVSVAFDGSGFSTDDAQYFIMDASTVEPGPYRITVRITDRVSGRVTERERMVELIADP